MQPPRLNLPLASFVQLLGAGDDVGKGGVLPLSFFQIAKGNLGFPASSVPYARGFLFLLLLKIVVKSWCSSREEGGLPSLPQAFSSFSSS